MYQIINTRTGEPLEAAETELEAWEIMQDMQEDTDEILAVCKGTPVIEY